MYLKATIETQSEGRRIINAGLVQVVIGLKTEKHNVIQIISSLSRKHVAVTAFEGVIEVTPRLEEVTTPTGDEPVTIPITYIGI